MDKQLFFKAVVKTNDESGDEAEWEDVDESEQIDIYAVDTKCLFCNEQALLPATIEHLKTVHSFDVYELKTIHNFSCYEYICFVNYLRASHPKVDYVKKQLLGTDKLWRDDKYLKPVHEDEPFLLLDIDNDEDAEMETERSGAASNGNAHPRIDEETDESSNQIALFNSQASSKTGSSELATLQRQLAALRAENIALRSTMRQLIEDEAGENDVDDEDEDDDESDHDNDNDNEGATKPKSSNDKPEAEKKAVGVNDEWYFESYDDFQIHLEMLTDQVRTDAYRDFVQKNAAIFNDKTVLDIGCGTGILSLFAARDTEAQRVVAVDRAGIAFDAMAIVRENSMTHRITVKHARVEDLRPQSASAAQTSAVEPATKGKQRKTVAELEHVDIILSEWMGYALLYECMLDSVLTARDMFTTGNSNSAPLVFPNIYTVWFAGIDDQDLTSRYVTYWNDVYGFSMSTMRSRVCRSVVQDTLAKAESIVTNAAQLREYDLRTLQRSDLEPFLLFSEFQLRANAKQHDVGKSTQVSAFCLWFDVAFVGCPQPVTFSTSPHSQKTHWQQSFMFLDEPIQLASEETLDCRLVIRRNPKEPRHLIFELFINGQQKTFMMS